MSGMRQGALMAWKEMNVQLILPRGCALQRALSDMLDWTPGIICEPASLASLTA